MNTYYRLVAHHEDTHGIQPQYRSPQFENRAEAELRAEEWFQYCRAVYGTPESMTLLRYDAATMRASFVASFYFCETCPRLTGSSNPSQQHCPTCQSVIDEEQRRAKTHIH